MRCIYLTDGSIGNQDSKIRTDETKNALSKIGVNTEMLIFVGVERNIPDGKLHACLLTAYESILDTKNEYEEIRALYIPAWEGGHQDHDAVHLVGLSIAVHFNLINRCFQFSLYHGDKLPGPFFKVMSPLYENGPIIRTKISFRNRLKFIRLCLFYPSQLKSWIGLFPFVFAHYLFTGNQYLQRTNLHRV